MSTSGCCASASPTTAPVPDTRLYTPAGRPMSSAISARMCADSGATSLGLCTTVQPGQQRRRDLGDRLVQRVVPRSDRRHHPDRLAHHHRVADRLGLVGGAGQRDVGVEHLERQAGLHVQRHLGRRTHLRGDGRGQLRLPLGDAVAKRAQQARTLGRRRRGPRREGRAGRADGAVDIRRRPLRHRRDHLLGRGVHHRDGAFPGRGDPLAPDVQPVLSTHAIPPSVRGRQYRTRAPAPGLRQGPGASSAQRCFHSARRWRKRCASASRITASVLATSSRPAAEMVSSA